MKFEIQDIQKSFGDKQVLKGVGFATESGKAFGLLGRNGAGKTTTIRIIMGVFPADDGRVLIDGAPINHAKTDIGYLPEEHGLYPRKKITEQLIYLAELRNIKPKQAKKSIDYWLGRLEMGEYANRRLDTLSKGNQQKIQMVAALATNPDFVILDEPFSGLDPVNAAMLKDVVKELIKTGKIVLFSSHQMNYVEEFCDSIAILHEGKIVLSGNIEAIKRSYDRSIIAVRAPRLDEVEQFCTGGQLAGLVQGTRRKQNQLLVQMKDPAQKLQLMTALSGQGIDVDAMAVWEPSLNDIFVQYTGEEQEEGVKA